MNHCFFGRAAFARRSIGRVPVMFAGGSTRVDGCRNRPFRRNDSAYFPPLLFPELRCVPLLFPFSLDFLGANTSNNRIRLPRLAT